MSTTTPVRVAIFGAGGRGAETYGRWVLEHPDRARVVAIADPQAHRRDSFGERAGVATDNRFSHWRDLLTEADRLDLDAVVVALPDNDHIEPTVAAAERGLAILLEKPVAPDEQSLRELENRLTGLQARIAVGHVLRATPFWRAVQHVTSTGLLGDLVTIRMEENIGFWHFAHSFVRGNWRRTDTSSPMVLAKTCHDLDIIRWLAEQAPTQVSSVGSLRHFHSGNAPEGAPSHCVKGCPVADTCPFYAPRYYVDALADVDEWPVPLLGPDTSREGRLAALAEGPYGRCVYRSDNDVVDHQQSIFTFPSGLTASLTTSAFTGENTRTVQITGTRGEISGRMDTGELRLQLFSPAPHDLGDLADSSADVRTSHNGPLGHTVYEWHAGPTETDAGDHRGHAGGDDVLTARFIDAVASGDFEAHIDTTFAASLDSHWMAFAAERARLGQAVTALEDVRA